MGLSLLVSAWLFYRASGGLFNPNVSLALVLCRVITPVRFVLYCLAQLAGGITAAALVLALMPGPLASNTTPTAGVNVAQAVFIEMFITAALCLAVLMLGAEKHNATPFAPVGVGLTLFACHLWAVFYTGAAMNTARAFGPAVVTGFPTGRHWVYWLGPGLGSLLAAAIYGVLRYVKYWRLNPDSDTTEGDEAEDQGRQPGTGDVEHNGRPSTVGEKGARRV
jgi:aquaporin related protein